MDICLCLIDANLLLFTALHGMQTRSSDENSVCLCVTRVHCDKTVERSVKIYIPYERSFSLVVSQFQSSTFCENYNAPCSAVSLR